MDAIQNLKEQYDIGYKSFEKLVKLSDLNLKLKLKDILADKLSDNDDLFELNTPVTRTIRNEKYTEITLSSYDWLSITPLGIHFHLEHGEATLLVKFDKYFNLDI